MTRKFFGIVQKKYRLVRSNLQSIVDYIQLIIDCIFQIVILNSNDYQILWLRRRNQYVDASVITARLYILPIARHHLYGRAIS